MRQLDAHLGVDRRDGDEVVVCRRCEHVLCGAEENYKRHALCEALPMTEAGPKTNPPSAYVDEPMEFRQFYCPGCGTLLENEVARSSAAPTLDKSLD